MVMRRSGGLSVKAVYIVDEMINILILAVFTVVILFCTYVYIDSGRLEREADVSRYTQYKPTQKEHLTFTQLCSLNPDVFGWITLEDTGVDYPLVQGRDNAEYVNRTPEKTFSLSGSIFLDYRNSRDLTDKVSIIYGHHMEKDRLFGSFDKFEDAGYFEEHQHGSIVLDDMQHSLDIFAYLTADGYDTSVYDPYISEEDFPTWIGRIMDIAITKSHAPDEDERVVLLSTCANMETNQRLILAGVLGEGKALPDTAPEEEGVVYIWIPVLITVGGAVGLALLIVYRKRKNKKVK